MHQKKSIYDCPVCGAQKAFNPLTKALAGGLNSKGKVCHACGAHCTNGKVSTIVKAVIYLVAAIGMILCYLFVNGIAGYFTMIGCIAVAFVVTKIIDAFFLPMEKTMRNDV